MDKKGLIRWVGWACALLLCGCRLAASVECDHLPSDSLRGNAGCLIQRDGALLMVQQRLDGRWALPGGTAETGERAACTAARETREETGLPVQVAAYLKTLDNGFHLYLCEVPADALAQPRDALEILEMAWVDEAERGRLSLRFPDQQAEVELLLQVVAAQPSN